jgi:AraC-like DNA-binding protein
MAPGFVFHGFWDELDKRGIAIGELERASGVSRPRKDDFTSTLSDCEIDRLLTAAVSLTGDSALGLSVRPAMSCASLHLVGHLILASVSFSAAIELLSSAGPEWCREPVIEDAGGDRVRLGFYSDMAPSPGACVKSQLVGVALHEMALHFSSGSSKEIVVQFDFPTPVDTSVFQRAFPGGVQFGANGTFVIFPRRVLHQRRSGANPALVRQLAHLAEHCYGTTDDDSTWTNRVRRALRTNTAPRLMEFNALAVMLGVPSRGLERRLTREGTTFSSLVDQVLYERAQALLSRPRTTCTQAAETLGYAELSSFNRAFRRWSGGLTPTEYRDRLRAAHSAS